MLLLLAWLSFGLQPEVAAHTPLVVEGGYVAPGSWIALIRGQPWICWHAPLERAQPEHEHVEDSCWHPLAMLRSARETRLCGKSESGDDVDLGLGIITIDEDDTSSICNESSDESLATHEGRWAFAFADDHSVWIRTPRGETFLGTPTATQPVRTRLVRLAAPALLALQQPRRLSCAVDSWLPQHRAGTWWWQQRSCEWSLSPDLTPQIARPAASHWSLQENRQLALRIRLHIEALRSFSGDSSQILDHQRWGQWSFFVGFRIEYRPAFEHLTNRREPDRT